MSEGSPPTGIGRAIGARRRVATDVAPRTGPDGVHAAGEARADGSAAPRGDEAAPASRKLIRPRLDQHVTRTPGRAMVRRRQTPDPTGVEASFLARSSSGFGGVVMTLEDGRVLTGSIDWIDRDCLELRPKDGPGIVVMKHAILHVAADGAPRRG